MMQPWRLHRDRGSTLGAGTILRLARGRPLALPTALDRAAEGWWRLPARMRMVGLVGLAILVVAGTVQRSSSTPWGPDVRVAVATHDVDAGHPVAAALAWRPARLVPEAALTTVPDGIATRDLGAGQVVTSNAVGDDLHDLLEPDEVALALAQELPALPADAPLVILGMAFDGTGQALGHGRLLAHTDSWTWIAVARGDAPRIAAATHTGGVQLALVPR